MLQHSKTFFSYSVTDIAAVQNFYRDVLGIKVEQTPEGLSLTMSDGGAGFLYPKPDHKPATFTVLNFIVDDIDAAVDGLKKQGVTFEQYDLPDLKTDAKGIMRSEGRGPAGIAWFKDPAGNILSVVQESAKA